MPHGDDVTTPPAVVPSPRLPHPADSAPLPPLPPLPALPPFPEPAEPRSRGKLVLTGVLALSAAVALGVGAAFIVHDEPLDAPAEAAASIAPAAPIEQANAVLSRQAAALLRGDEKAWLAAVDPRQPKLLARYKTMFRSLRALGVSHFQYQTSIANDKSAAGSLGIFADVAYCLAGDNCVKERGADSAGPPIIAQTLKLKTVKGQWHITSVNNQRRALEHQPVPWENNALATAEGKRVTLVALQGEKDLHRLLPIAEQAATTTDRFAGLVGNPQQRYRIYLAGRKNWKVWYGGIKDQWVVGYALPRNEAGTDVVLNLTKLRNDERLLATTIRHELGHVVTVGGVRRGTRDGTSAMWLKEGIAEYIGWHPRPATASWRRQAVRDAVHSSRPPTSIAVDALGENASAEEGDAFYGLGHFAADCMARKYGERALFTFVRLHLRENRELDPASQEAFGTPFQAVDKACVAWIRDRA
ncbi:hypothetical protein [Couchioplanes caeruleus]|uniref:Peptidase MA superfamily protein n=2 Tax=Couchioplanes caeruleus TaxID=56438 RepID=A0A1K0FR55_9ACTN|nr:hypothetical protein [Couchioplanes caeruleus]OJF15273.1 hypothetical protein BG844_05265 [Couchioplanes caeruleus subsp. caeruleus]ROP30791.1 hypothetical protein EDD30_3655 [Couchioplanes caeruleus]